MQPATDGALNAVAEEPPSKNVRVARRGVAAGLLALVIYMILATYTAMTGWRYSEQVALTRGALILGMIAGLGVALYGYGVERSARNCANANTELIDRFRDVLAEVEVDRMRRERRVADRLEEVAEQMEREQAILRLRPNEPKRTVAKVPRQRRRGRQAPSKDESVPDNVRHLRSVPGGMDALKRIAKQIIDNPDR